MAREALVLVPGLMCDQAVWQPVMPALSSVCDCTVADPGAVDSLPLMASNLLANAPARFALAGHSMGARIALEVLRQAPERVSRVALLDSGYLPLPGGAAGDEETRKRHDLLEVARTRSVAAMARTWVKGMVQPARLHDTALVEAIVAMFARRSVDSFACQIAALLQRPDASEVLRGVLVPAMVACGREDSWAPPVQHEAMCKLVPGGRLEIVDGAGHMAPMERPEAVADCMLRWLGRR